MVEQRKVLPNSADAFYVEEMRQRFAEGHIVRMCIGGNSMQPLIDGSSDIVRFEPLPPELKVGDIYFFFFQGQCVTHRLIRIRGDELVFRGDNCMRHEHVGRKDVLARLKTVEHSDGTVDECDSTSWHRRSRRVVLHRTLVNTIRRIFSYRQRRWMRWVYFILLLVLMWAPVGGIGVPLNNFVLGIRLDHLLHASVYIPCVFFLMDFWRGRQHRSRLGVAVWLVASVIAVTTETVQYLLPYRGFDINDLVSNILGVTLGWLIVRLLKK